MKIAAAITISLMTVVGCGRTDNVERSVKLPAEIIVTKPVFATQRFIPTNSGDVAFDTKTGTLCKTWGWESDSADYRRNISRQITNCQSLYFDDLREENRNMAAAKQ